jgi:hypothetical protein
MGYGGDTAGYGGDTAGVVAGSLQAGVVVAMESSVGEREEALLWSYPWFPAHL